jgi:cation diffusion facilitator family transporter
MQASVSSDTVSRELESVRHEPPDRSRQRLYRRAILIALIGNVVLAAAKATVAWISGSSAVLSDAANSLSDTLYSLLMAAGLYVAQQPADESHPQGHSRFEPLVSLLISLAMTAAGLAAVSEGVRRFRVGPMAIAPGWPTAVLLFGAAVKVAMYALVRDVGEKAGSPAIRASARDNLADVLASLAALLGVLGSRFVHPLLDPVAGVLVALWIFRATWEILYENLGYLTGRGAPQEVTADIVEAASSVPGVLGIHRVIADHVGPDLRVDMHIDVDGEMTLREAHAIAEQVGAQVEALPNVGLAFVHVEPVERDATREA